MLMAGMGAHLPYQLQACVHLILSDPAFSSPIYLDDACQESITH